MALAAAAWRLGGEKRAQPQRGDAGRCEESRRWKEKGVGTLCVIKQVCGKQYFIKVSKDSVNSILFLQYYMSPCCDTFGESSLSLCMRFSTVSQN